jgi:pimeloyl-ACP methyl ester carboxylesterase
MSYEAMTGDLLDWLNEQDLPRATFLGHSMGGKVAMLLACRHPGRVESLAVVDIAPKAYFWPERREEFAAMAEIDLSTLSSRAEAEKILERRVPDWALRRFLLTNLERLEGGGWRWLANLPVLSRELPALEKSPLGPGDSFPGPALFITGGKSRYVEPGDHAEILRHFPAAAIRTIPGSAHNPHMETRGEFVSLIRNLSV